MPGPEHQLLNTLQTETIDSVGRHAARRVHLQSRDGAPRPRRPRVLYLALGETDDWAHDGRYDRVLEAYARSDAYLAQLWNWLQSQPEYKGRTHILITTDHGRGRTVNDWRDHGAKIEGAQDVWMAFASPAMARRGEWQIARAALDQSDCRDPRGLGRPRLESDAACAPAARFVEDGRGLRDRRRGRGDGAPSRRNVSSLTCRNPDRVSACQRRLADVRSACCRDDSPEAAVSFSPGMAANSVSMRLSASITAGSSMGAYCTRHVTYACRIPESPVTSDLRRTYRMWAPCVRRKA